MSSISVNLSARQTALGAFDEDSLLLLIHAQLLREHGVQVTFSPEGAPAGSFDIIHSFGIEPAAALSASHALVPLVSTPLLERVPRSLMKTSLEVVAAFSHASCTDEIDSKLSEVPSLSELWETQSEIPFSLRVSSSLVSSSVSESLYLERFGNSSSMRLPESAAFGFFDTSAEQVSLPENVAEYLVSIGSIAPVNNQLMLLHALREESMPVLLVTYGEDDTRYLSQCRRIKRKGPTYIHELKCLSEVPSILKRAAVYVHPALHSTGAQLLKEYKLHSKRMAVSDTSELPSAFLDSSMRFNPISPQAIRDAVLTALQSEQDESFRVDRKAWQGYGEELFKLYHDVIQTYQLPSNAHLKDRLQKEAKREIAFSQLARTAHEHALHSTEGARLALERINRFFHVNPDYVPFHYVSGIAQLMLDQKESAEESFRKVINLEPRYHASAYLYLGLALYSQNKIDAANDVLLQFRNYNLEVPEGTQSFMYEFIAQLESELEEGAMTPLTRSIDDFLPSHTDQAEPFLTEFSWRRS